MLIGKKKGCRLLTFPLFAGGRKGLSNQGVRGLEKKMKHICDGATDKRPGCRGKDLARGKSGGSRMIAAVRCDKKKFVYRKKDSRKSGKGKIIRR